MNTPKDETTERYTPGPGIKNTKLPKKTTPKQPERTTPKPTDGTTKKARRGHQKTNEVIIKNHFTNKENHFTT